MSTTSFGIGRRRRLPLKVRARRWWSRNWPLVVVGAYLAAFFVVAVAR